MRVNLPLSVRCWMSRQRAFKSSIQYLLTKAASRSQSERCLTSCTLAFSAETGDGTHLKGLQSARWACNSSQNEHGPYRASR
jgi:hypothetical protein